MDSIQPRKGWLPFRRVNQLKNGGFNHKFFSWWNDWGHGVMLCRFVFELLTVMTATLQFSIKPQWNISECQNWKYCISSKCSSCIVRRACADTVRPTECRGRGTTERQPALEGGEKKKSKKRTVCLTVVSRGLRGWGMGFSLLSLFKGAGIL